jgi:hypothetical protein
VPETSFWGLTFRRQLSTREAKRKQPPLKLHYTVKPAHATKATCNPDREGSKHDVNNQQTRQKPHAWSGSGQIRQLPRPHQTQRHLFSLGGGVKLSQRYLGWKKKVVRGVIMHLGGVKAIQKAEKTKMTKCEHKTRNLPQVARSFDTPKRRPTERALNLSSRTPSLSIPLSAFVTKALSLVPRCRRNWLQTTSNMADFSAWLSGNENTVVHCFSIARLSFLCSTLPVVACNKRCKLSWVRRTRLAAASSGCSTFLLFFLVEGVTIAPRQTLTLQRR